MNNTEKTSFFSFLPFLTLITFASFLNIMARIIFPPMTPFICEEMNLCHADIGNLFFILSVGFAITLFGSQFLSSRISHKMTVIFSLLSTGFALVITSYAESFQFFRLSIFLVGLCSGFFIPSAVAILREGVATQHLGKAFGIFATAQSVAFILSPIIVRSVIEIYSWKEILNGFGLISSIISVVLFFLFKQGNEKGEPITIAFVRSVFSWPSFWILLILLCLANGLNIGIYNMAPDYFQRHNLLDKDAVHQLIVIARVLSFGTAIVAGVVADRFGLKRSMVLSLVFCGALTSLMGAMNPSSSLVLFTLQSPVAACLMPLIHFAIATIVPPEKNSTIVSLIAPFGFLMGAGVVPQLLGFLGDFNLYAQGFVLFGMASIFCGAIFNLSRVYKHVEFSQVKSLES
ncbi:MFS transporter [Candidatus Neptunichlamydia sp. REUL1]|uniref:MFS transporter n=1 Tax=Candidatus Neptunichlamydia sp. REUL1 TaxID=3064277 RepID=UPI00292F1FD9|nr:MFS transporter [Candidatus Neptunochlamydia sp. REUL1]